MPTYQYECLACHHMFEKFQSITEGKLRKCPTCAKFQLQRHIGTGAGIIFKGSGFYETDYKRAQPASKKEAAAPASGAANPQKSCGCGSNKHNH